MIAAILSLLGSSAFGTILGGVFAWLNHRVDIESKKLDLDHEKDRWTHELAVRSADLEYAKAEAAARKDVAIIEGDNAIETARMSAIAASQTADQVTADQIHEAGGMGWMLVLALAFTKLVRPVATVVLTGAAVYLNWLLVDKLATGWPQLTPDQRFDASMQAFAWITGQAAAALSYWFVSRGNTRSKA